MCIRDSLNWTGTGSDVEILPLTDYTTRISNATGGSQQTPLDGLSLTTLDANANASDHIDSDASIVSTNAEIDIMTGDWGAVNHKLDYGFTATPACTNPTVTAFAIQPSCTNNAPNSDGYLQLSAVSGGDAYHWSEGNTFDDMSGANTYANATDLTGVTYPLQFATGQTNPSGSRAYTIRVYNGANDCFTDVVVTMQEQDCTVGCDCEEYLYVNEPEDEAIHKFLIHPDDSLSEINPIGCLLYTSPSPRDRTRSRMPSSA